MKTGVIGLSVVPGRKEPNDRSEMITQLLFGEEYSVIEEQLKWLKIKGNSDEYECWIDRKQHLESDHIEQVIVTGTLGDHWLNLETEERILLCPGSIIRETPTFHPSFEGEIELHLQTDNIKDVEEVAYQFINSPYLWGGKSELGIDCSGFTQVVFRTIGINIPRDAWQQAEKGKLIPTLEKAVHGDLAFFCSMPNSEDMPKVTHVGIILEDQFIVHASGWVRLDRIDERGIFNEELDAFSHKLLSIRRF